MKVSQKQASLLASEIIRQLKSKKVQRVSEEVKERLRLFFKKRKELFDIEKKAEEARRQFDNTLIKITGTRKCEAYHKFDKIIDIMEEKNLPTTTEVENEIILKSMFASEDDLQSFLDKIVSKYSKKINTHIPVNN